MTTKPKTPNDQPTPSDWHNAFLAMLPRIEQHAHVAFCDLQGDNKDEAVQEAICNACEAFARLVEQDRPEAANPSSLGRFAVAHVREGRQVGIPLNIKDVSSRYCQRRKGVKVRSLERWCEQDQTWQEVLVEDKTCTPADLAASRIDYPAFLELLSHRERRIAETLATGESTGHVAKLFGISAGRISQLRQELKAAWEQFHGEESGELATV